MTYMFECIFQEDCCPKSVIETLMKFTCHWELRSGNLITNPNHLMRHTYIVSNHNSFDYLSVINKVKLLEFHNYISNYKLDIYLYRWQVRWMFNQTHVKWLFIHTYNNIQIYGPIWLKAKCPIKETYHVIFIKRLVNKYQVKSSYTKLIPIFG